VTHLTLRSAVFNAYYEDLPEDYLSHQELFRLVRSRPSVPHFLKCYVCMLLVDDPVWLPCCKILACAGCLGPLFAADLVTVCPACGRACTLSPATSEAPLRVSALKKCADAWARADMETRDPYTVPPNPRAVAAFPGQFFSPLPPRGALLVPPPPPTRPPRPHHPMQTPEATEPRTRPTAYTVPPLPPLTPQPQPRHATAHHHHGGGGAGGGTGHAAPFGRKRRRPHPNGPPRR